MNIEFIIVFIITYLALLAIFVLINELMELIIKYFKNNNKLN